MGVSVSDPNVVANNRITNSLKIPAIERVRLLVYASRKYSETESQKAMKPPAQIHKIDCNNVISSMALNVNFETRNWVSWPMNIGNKPIIIDGHKW